MLFGAFCTYCAVVLVMFKQTNRRLLLLPYIHTARTKPLAKNTPKKNQRYFSSVHVTPRDNITQMVQNWSDQERLLPREQFFKSLAANVVSSTTPLMDTINIKVSIRFQMPGADV